MKEATGELSMTVIVIVGAIVIVGIVSWLSPRIKNYVEMSWGEVVTCPNGQKPVDGYCPKQNP